MHAGRLRRHPRLREDIGPTYRAIVGVMRPVLRVATRIDWSGAANIPATGGFVVAPNHISYIDPLILGDYLVEVGRAPRFLAKSTLFDVPVFGRIMKGTAQIPVYRQSDRAIDAYSAALNALGQGACVCVMPEGTVTRDPRMWPMTGKTGAARLALETGLPLVPVGMWGAQHILKAYEQKVPRVFPRKKVQVYAGPPVDLSDLAHTPIDTVSLSVATDRLMDAVTEQVSLARGVAPPPDRYDLSSDDARRGGHR